MSDALSLRKAVVTRDTLSISPAADHEHLPVLSALMAGVGAPDGRTWASPPHTLTLWLEGQICKFALGAGDLEPKCFGTIGGLSDGLEGVEKALNAGQCEWKKAKVSPISLPNRR